MKDNVETILLLGHGGCYNRGCEAIVESTVAMFREIRPALRFILLSFDATHDRKRAPAIVDLIEPGYAQPASVHGFIARLVYRVSRRRSMNWLAEPVKRVIPEADLVLSIGGDNYCYEDSEYFYYIDDLIRKAGKPLMLWGATVELNNPSAAKIADLRAFNAITTREPLTVQVLAKNGITCGVHLVSDPAFILKPISVDTTGFWPKRSQVLGLNLSPLVGRYTGHGPDSIFHAGVELVRYAVEKNGVGVLLIPHVTEPMPRKEKWNDDAVLLERICREVNRPGEVTLMPSGLSAAATKFVIARCAYFMGARTHSTIAALSSGVPTVTLAYSAKAHGINQSLFGDSRWVLDVCDFQPDKAIALFDKLIKEGPAVSAHLRGNIGGVMERARRGASIALELLDQQKCRNASGKTILS